MKKILFAAIACLSMCLYAQKAVPPHLETHNTWRKLETRNGSLTSRELFYYASALCRAGVLLERLDKIFDMAREMQDRNADSTHFGNYRWSLRDGVVLDSNAVEFCMEGTAVLWKDFSHLMTQQQKDKLMDLVEYSIKGCINHKVNPGYTNIAIMNFQNLILLGEVFNRPDVLKEGLKRLNTFMIHTAVTGISEYSSPTYTAVDIACLHRLWKHTKLQDVKDKTDKLLQLFWYDIAASTFVPANRLGGAHSRDYNYLFGHGDIDRYLRGAGLIPSDPPPTSPFWKNDDWKPSAEILAMANVTPRLLTARWGDLHYQNRVLWIGKNIALSVAGANYHNMDIAMSVNFDDNEKRTVRGYFIPDGRRDPYGKKLIPEGSGAHSKTLHLKPFWGGTQREKDALGLVVYRRDDIPPTSPTLESHFVLPANADEIHIDNEPIVCEKGKPFVRILKPSQALFIRSKDGAAGFKVPWARALDGGEAQVALVWDDNPFFACRLTVAHHDIWGSTPDVTKLPAAAFWVRVTDDAGKPATYAKWRQDFIDAGRTVRITNNQIQIAVQGEGGLLELTTKAPYASLAATTPKPNQSILSINGRDIGKELLSNTPGVKEYLAELERIKKLVSDKEIHILPNRDTYWEAERGFVHGEMVIAEDKDASGGKIVWSVGEPGQRGHKKGSVTWQVNIHEDGTYYLWGRVNTPTPEDDSFQISISTANGDPVLPRSDWHLTMSNDMWIWNAYPTNAPQPFQLSKGRYTISLNIREDGTKIDRLVLMTSLQEP